MLAARGPSGEQAKALSVLRERVSVRSKAYIYMYTHTHTHTTHTHTHTHSHTHTHTHTHIQVLRERVSVLSKAQTGTHRPGSSMHGVLQTMAINLLRCAAGASLTCSRTGIWIYPH